MGINEQSCIDCHGADLTSANDSHPKSKFTDPRNADLLGKLDATKCITCHIEHRHDRTHAMGLTIPEDYCLYCHEDIAEERVSHKSYAFNSCATAGCHNFHDNTALYEDFLAKHLDEPDFKEPTLIMRGPLKERMLKSEVARFLKPDGIPAPDAPIEHLDLSGSAHRDWLATAHAKAGVNCSDCHVSSTGTNESDWNTAVSHTSCQKCHQDETQGWLKGKHGMRLAQSSTPMTTDNARLPMNPNMAHKSLSCTSCHGAHTFDTKQASVASCLECHSDEHSKNYVSSPHYELWRTEQDSDVTPYRGVSCATCHLPLVEKNRNGESTVHVEHNQNWNLEPNEKMIRSVCLECHGLEFSIDALADPDLIKTNFQGLPSRHVESIDLVRRRTEEK